MHTNPSFLRWPEQEAYAFARARGFGMLTIAASEGPLASHIPFLLSGDGTRAEFHLLRSSALSRALQAGEATALLAVIGPDAYISPDWYGDIPDQVPTWNYQAVHLRGAARVLPHDQLRSHLQRLAAHFEERLAPKAPWTLDKMTEGAVEKMSRAIVPGEMSVTKMESTLKLGQNKTPEARLGAARGVAEIGLGSEPAVMIAEMMRDSVVDED